MQPLDEKDFIQDNRKDPYPMWYWMAFVLAILTLMWGMGSWYQNYMSNAFAKTPFLQVTNRSFSIFLWENPEFMRANVQNKRGYLPDFEYLDRVGLVPEKADAYVVAPPDVIFRYHVWSRLVGNEVFVRPIPREEFALFLQEAPEWHPKYWPDAPKQYVNLVKNLAISKTDDLQELPQEDLPNQVRRAFIGWKNFFKEGEAINVFRPSYSLVNSFLQKYPNYHRNYWRNILEAIVPGYLKTTTNNNDPVPNDELAPFLRTALFNYYKSDK